MKRKTLSFEELSKEFEVLSENDLTNLKGGIREWGKGPDGSWYYREKDSGDPWTALKTLEFTFSPTGSTVDANESMGTYFWPGGTTYVPGETPGGTGGNNNTTNGGFALTPSISDATLVENMGVVWGVAGGVWSAHGSYGITTDANGRTTVGISAAVTPQQSAANPFAGGNIKVFYNGVQVASTSLTETNYPNGYYYEAGTIPLEGHLLIPEGMNGMVDVEITIGSYDDTGAGAQGTSKTYTVTLFIPPPPNSGPGVGWINP